MMSLYKNEVRTTLILGLVFAFRMLGLFMILPIFSTEAKSLAGATPALIGFTLGVYGLTQAVFQIPFSAFSDKVGRKPIILFGLVLFCLGSLFAGFSDSIWGVAFGRALQGSGAIGSVILALLSDLTKVENRTKAMGVIGMFIGLSFILAMILGPLFQEWFGLPGLFFVMTGMGLFGLLVVAIGVDSPSSSQNQSLSLQLFKEIFSQADLLRLDLGIFIQHAILTVVFIALPYVLSQTLQLDPGYYWAFYLLVFLLAVILMFPTMIFSEKKRCVKPVFLLAVLVLAFSSFVLGFWGKSYLVVITVLSFFFFAFTLLESFLPSWVSRVAPIRGKGTAMGVYSTFQFLGIFFGGTFGGIVLGYFGVQGVFFFAGILAIMWLPLGWMMQAPPYLTTQAFKFQKMNPNGATQLTQDLLVVKGISEVFVAPEEEMLYLKVDRQQLDKTKLEQIISTI